MSKITVEQFLNAGFEFTVGDWVVSGEEDFVVTNSFYVSQIRARSNLDSEWTIKSLAPRQNTGAQPVDDDCVVEATGNNGNVSVERAINVPWFKTVDKSQNGAVYAVVTWKPSLKHLENQMDKPVFKTNLTRDEFNAVKAHSVIEWKVGDKCYTDKRLVQCTFVGAMADNVNCVLQDYDADMLIVPMAELERVVDRLESAYELYCTCGIQHETVSIESFELEYADVWLAVVDKTGYRK